MKKKKKPSKPLLSYPPQGFWISPGGAVVPVQIHAEMLILMPEVFGLERAPHGRDEINAAIADVLERGWVRARVLSAGHISFQVWKADAETVALIYGVLVEHHAGISHVAVETVDPRGWWEFTLREFEEKRFPTHWGLGGEEP